VRVLGVDACPAGWVGVTLEESAAPLAYVAADIATLVALAGPLAVVGIDIPIGLPDATARLADTQARAVLGRLWPSIFLTPVRAALEAPDHATAVAVNREATGKGVSIQAYGLRAKILQVDGWLRTGPAPVVVEVHPEVSFVQMAGERLDVPKKTWAGSERRRALLAAQGIELAGDLGLAGHLVGVDDVLDAGAAAWTAERVAAGTARCFPDPPEVFADGPPAAIWA
jgi:predicted RNase H-like nuclease